MTRHLSEAIGSQLRLIRTDNAITIDEMARAARDAGLGWSRPTLSMIEAGKRGLSVDELFALPLVLQRLGVEVSVVELVGDDPVLVTPTWQASRAGIALLFNGGNWGDSSEIGLSDDLTRGLGNTIAASIQELRRSHPSLPEDVTVGDLRAAEMDEATQKASRRLDQTPFEIAAASITLWGRSLTEERNARVSRKDLPEPTLRALRGRATRGLLDELGDYFATAGVHK